MCHCFKQLYANFIGCFKYKSTRDSLRRELAAAQSGLATFASLMDETLPTEDGSNPANKSYAASKIAADRFKREINYSPADWAKIGMKQLNKDMDYFSAGVEHVFGK